MLRERLKNMDLKITELADYLQVSRPTMYKFIDYYDSKNFNLINKKILKLFNYIEEHELAGKKNVVNYILTKLVDLKEVGEDKEIDTIKQIKKFIIANPESKKSQFITTCATKNCFDKIIFYLMEIYPLLNKKKLSPEEQLLITPYKNLLNDIKGGNF